MNWDRLYTMQQKLDAYIMDNHDLNDKNVFNEKYLAFLVELGELANETRCFKYWSTKPPSDKHIILAEYVDGIHFLLSLGLETGCRYTEQGAAISEEVNQTEQFNAVYTAAASFKDAPTQEKYEHLFSTFLGLGSTLGFTGEDVVRAYFKKNEINYERQNQGY